MFGLFGVMCYTFDKIKKRCNMRKFEVVRADSIKYENSNVTLPVRHSKTSVAYDFYSPADLTILPGTSALVWTNVKATFAGNEGLILTVRSSMGKYGVILANGIGVIESDYYGNESNDGNIGFRLFNMGNEPYVIKIGDRIGQGFFINYLTVDDEVAPENVRKGGFGSTGK